MTESFKDEIPFLTEEKKQLESNLRIITNEKENLEVRNHACEEQVKKMESELQYMEEMLKDGNSNKDSEEFNELKEKFKTLEDINKQLENKSEDVADEHSRCSNLIKTLDQKVKAGEKEISGYLLHLKVLEEKIKEKDIVSEPEANSDVEINSKDQVSNDFEILMSQKNIAESKASIMERKVIKLE